MHALIKGPDPSTQQTELQCSRTITLQTVEKGYYGLYYGYPHSMYIPEACLSCFFALPAVMSLLLVRWRPPERARAAVFLVLLLRLLPPLALGVRLVADGGRVCLSLPS